MPLKKGLHLLILRACLQGRYYGSRKTRGLYSHENLRASQENQLACFLFLEENLASLMANRGIWYEYGSFDLSRERDEMLARDKFEEDRRFISLMCSELYFFSKFVTTQLSATDEITSYFRGFWTNQRIPLWLVFAV